ncbi:hypothetical protein ABZY93_26070 [Streptomyces smyrnaeus]|uniref:hypothetical protein n=1 Tax=Streptomyces smyrnaeus TaxID=1387713 RepID=UPI0033A75826
MESTARKSANADGLMACVEPAPAQRFSPKQAATIAARTPVPMPEWCFQAGDGTWFFNRFQGCSVSVWTLNVKKIKKQKILGQLTFPQEDSIYSTKDSSAWGHRVAIEAIEGWGRIKDISVSGVKSVTECTGDCTLDDKDVDFPKQAVKMTGVQFGQILPVSTVKKAGTKGTARTRIVYKFDVPSWSMPPQTLGSQPPFYVRCDNKTPGVPKVGCVIPNFRPVSVVSLSGPYPNYARHIHDAQASGLPGAYVLGAQEQGPPLTRLTDGKLRKKNGDTACPQAGKGGYPRPAKHSCDEYPFRSTYEGAYTGIKPPPKPGDPCLPTRDAVPSTGARFPARTCPPE